MIPLSYPYTLDVGPLRTGSPGSLPVGNHEAAATLSHFGAARPGGRVRVWERSPGSGAKILACDG